MKYIKGIVWGVITWAIIILAMALGQLFTAEAQAPEITRVDVNDPIAVEKYIRYQAREWGVDEDLAVFIAKRESGLNVKARGDIDIFYKGVMVESRGIWQISKAYHPTVPDRIAYNLYYSTAWAMPLLKTNPEMWTTYKHYEG